ncbi:histidine phosphatase family protein [Nocardioides sp.]|uniref:SixA phosphatase family protein n=1 Tax=Nocardioides sp. TaxID=35761 RepID=UPI0027338D64|nr:histidine phosphatase family protein [Nocardioides sp.]MDP3891196.1 histidine phosphatase family protein [Nocardioides sp.]
MRAAHRTIVVMRHAKAEQIGHTDFERALSRRGHADGEAAGAWLAALGVDPDHALVSAALRTRETWSAVAAGAAWSLEPALDEGLYAAGPETALDLVRALDPSVECVVVIGHNPTMAYLASMLDDGEGDPEAGNALATGFPTSAVAVFAYSGDWPELDSASARLTGFHVARG